MRYRVEKAWTVSDIRTQNYSFLSRNVTSNFRNKGKLILFVVAWGEQTCLLECEIRSTSIFAGTAEHIFKSGGGGLENDAGGASL